MLSDEEIAAAIELGRRQAEEIILFRNEKLERRRAIVTSLDPDVLRPGRGLATLGLGEEAVPDFNVFGVPGRATIVAEGDSWFDYPFDDVLRLLEDDYGYDIESVAHKGDKVESMAYGKGQFGKVDSKN